MHSFIHKLIVFVCITLMSFSLCMEAHAKRFGGGKSFGMSRTSSSYSQRSNSLSSHYSKSQNNRLRPSLRSFLGPIAGFMLGGLLASLFMGHGFGAGMLSWLAVFAVIFFIWQLMRSRFKQPLTSPVQFTDYQSSQAEHNDRDQPHPFYQPNSSGASGQSTQTIEGFDSGSFLREAKSLFIRLQAAYDQKNLSDLRLFTSPEVFAEIQLQMSERGNIQNITEVVHLNAEMLGTDMFLREAIASVRFSGSIKEDGDQAAHEFVEIWHFKKSENQSQWIVAGIQQEDN